MTLTVKSASRLAQRPPGPPPARWAIVESWERCRKARLRAQGKPLLHRVDEAELSVRLARSHGLVEEARPRLDRLVRQLTGASNVAYLTDADGVILLSIGSLEQVRRFGLGVGSVRAEVLMGTNAAGTCLALGRPMIVAGKEHFMEAFHDYTCTAAPIHGTDGGIAGVIDVTSTMAEAREHRIVQVTEAALEIQEALRRS
jgi:transcriptional regulator of acetoin/glycerol metabolism